MGSFCVHMPAMAPAEVVAAQMAAAGHDDAKLRRSLVGGGAAKAAAALLLALSRLSVVPLVVVAGLGGFAVLK